MRFAEARLLWLLLLVPVAALAYAFFFRMRRRLLGRLGQVEMIRRMTAGVSIVRKVLRAALLVTVLGLMAVSLARPQAGGRAKLTRQRGLDLVVALDFSKSMLAKDVYPSRLERAKRELERLMDHLAGDRVGLVAFAGETLTYPPTTDYSAIKLFWRDMSPWDLPVGGTALGRALQASTEILTRLRSKEVQSEGSGEVASGNGGGRSQAILLLTDGEDTESEPLQAAEDASKVGIKVFTVGIGSRSGELIPEFDDRGQVTGYVKDADGKYVTSRLGEETLTRIAQLTGGAYFHADARQFGVEQVEAALAGLKRSDNEARVVKEYDEIYEIPLLVAFLLLVAEACASDRRGAGRLPRGPKGHDQTPDQTGHARRSPRLGAGTAALPLVFLLGLFPFLVGFEAVRSRSALIEEGNARMKAGKAEEALGAYEKALAELPTDPGAHFDRGTALSALSRFDEAAEEFLRATEARDVPLKEAAFYNLGNAFFKKDKFQEAADAYRRALALDPGDERAKWNLEIALKKKHEDDKQKKNDKKDQKDQKDQKKDDKPDDKKDDKQQQDKDKKDDQKDQAKDKPQEQQSPKDKPQDQSERERAAQEIDSVLDSLEKSPKELEQQRARLRAVRRAPPIHDW